MKFNFIRKLNTTTIICVFIVIIGLIVSFAAFLMGSIKNYELLQENNNNNYMYIAPEKKYNFKEATVEDKKAFNIKSNVVYENNITKVYGTIKNNSDKTNTIQVVAKMYKSNGNVSITNQQILQNLIIGESRSFEIDFQGNYLENNYDVEVQYIE